jgi:hypothetical protein
MKLVDAPTPDRRSKKACVAIESKHKVMPIKGSIFARVPAVFLDLVCFGSLLRRSQLEI